MSEAWVPEPVGSAALEERLVQLKLTWQTLSDQARSYSIVSIVERAESLWQTSARGLKQKELLASLQEYREQERCVTAVKRWQCEAAAGVCVCVEKA
jgi:hypothetical protein